MSRTVPVMVVTTLAEVIAAVQTIRDYVNAVLRRMTHDRVYLADAADGPSLVVLSGDPRKGEGFQATIGSLGFVYKTATYYKKTGPLAVDWTLTTI